MQSGSMGGVSQTGRSWYERLPVEPHGHRKKLDFFLESLESFRRERGLEVPEVRILEVGCSNGTNLSLPLAERGFDFTGVDLHEPSIAWAVSHNEFPNARFICQDAAEFSSRESFHVVILSDILEHVEEPGQLLLLAKRLLHEGGMVLICLPNGYGPAELERRLLERTRIDSALRALRRGINRLRGRERISYNDDSGHVQYFRTGSLDALVHDCGFVVDECRNGALFGGALTYPLGLLAPPVVRASLHLADRLPRQVVSTWYLRCSVRE